MSIRGSATWESRVRDQDPGVRHALPPAGAAVGIAEIAEGRAAELDRLVEHGRDRGREILEPRLGFSGFRHQRARLHRGPDV